MGEEYTCLAYYDQPDLMRDMLNTVKDTAIKVLERITEKLVIDNLHTKGVLRDDKAAIRKELAYKM